MQLLCPSLIFSCGSYGYSHPPRAVKDVTDLGIPIERFSVKAKDGRTIAAYKFGDPSEIGSSAHTGRRNFPKKFKKLLIETYGCKCALCFAEFEPSHLQIDHRVPYVVGGQKAGELDAADYLLVCRSCNRAKSWSCEHCSNWTTDKKESVCNSCFWANPTSYQHIALRQIRRLNLVWTEEETAEFDELSNLSKKNDSEMPAYVKLVLRKHLSE